MEAIFLKLLNMSITASWLVLAVFVLRLLLKKAPRYISVILWAMVGVRLICPFSFESVLSLIPSAETVPQNIIYSNSPAIESGVPIINNTINQVITENLAPTPEASANPMQIIAFVATVVWILGVLVMIFYTVFSYLRIERKVREAVQYEGNVWLCDHVDTPFILGIVRPRIYLPSNISKQDMDYVIAHEKAHLKRRDHIWKPLGFMLLAVYWFNPALWFAYILLCKDIEFACDEKVLKQMGSDIKKHYSDALINCSVPRKMISACPLAFGEVGVKGRIKSVLNYKKPAFWIVIVAVITSIAVAVCFLTNPKKDATGDNDKVSNTSSGSSQNSDDKNSSNNNSNQNNTSSVISQTQKEDLSKYSSWYSQGADSGLSLSSINALKERFPQFFNLKTDGGITVYIWQTSENNYFCSLINTNTAAKTDQSFAFSSGTTIAETRAILSTYDIDKSDITVTPVKNPLFGYDYKIDAKYKEKVKNLFWQDDKLLFSIVTEACDHLDDFKFNAVNEQKLKSGESKNPVYKIDSLESFEEFKTALLNAVKATGAIYPNISSFEEATKGFDQDFFKSHSLILVSHVAGSGSWRYDVHSIEYTDKSFKIHVVNTLLPDLLITADIQAWFVTVAVPKTLIKDCTDFDADLNNVTIKPNIDELKLKYPKYFNLNTKGGLDVYLWYTSMEHVYGGILPVKSGGYKDSELQALAESSASIDELRAILGYYVANGYITKDKVNVKLITMPHTEFDHTAESARQHLEEVLWSDHKFAGN